MLATHLTPVEVLNAVEGQLADLFAVRGRLSHRGRLRVWPSAVRWPQLVCAADARLAAAGVAV